MRKSAWAAFFALFSVLVLFNLANAQQSIYTEYTDDSSWLNLEPGTLVHAQIIEAPDGIYNGVACDDEARKVENQLRFEASMQVSARHTILDRGGNLVLRAVNGQCAQILPQRGFQYTDSGLPVYIETRFLRLLLPSEMTPISIDAPEHSPDKLILVLADSHELFAFEGTNPVLRVPVRMGPTPIGDHRGYRATVGYDMTGFNAVPWTVDFGGGYNFHGAPWWDWDQIGQGSGGSHGCINMPGDDWYQIRYGGQSMGPAQWLWRWSSANLSYDATSQDPEGWFTEVDSDAAWWEGTSSIRVLVINNLYELYQYPISRRLGGAAANASVQSWDEIINVVSNLGHDWLLTHVDEAGISQVEMIQFGLTPAESQGREVGPTFVMLDCDDPAQYYLPSAPGSVRTVGETCAHIRLRGVICTLDLDLIVTMCDSRVFDASTLEIRGELIEHEDVHQSQFGGYFGVLVDQGIAGNDPSPFTIDWHQVSLVGIAELMAQTVNAGSFLEDDYIFTLVRPDENGELVLVSSQATTQQTWDHLHRECGDPEGNDAELQALMQRALSGDGEAFVQLEGLCSLPPYQLVPDKSH